MTEEQAPAVGVITTNRVLVVQSWDAWMARATGLLEPQVKGRALAELFPDIVERGLLARLERVAAGKGVEILAPAFHKYLIPCKPQDPASRFEMMRQHVTISPLRDAEQVVGVVITIQDVTARLDAEHELALQLENPNEPVRFRAAESMTKRDASPTVAVKAMADASWRVRRAAVMGMARNTGSEAIATLVDAIAQRHRDPALLNSALTALSMSGDNETVFAVASLLDGGDADIRIYAALALGMLGDPRALPALLARLDDTDANVRYHAIEALGRIGDRGAAERVMAVAEARDFFLSFAALEALAQIGERSLAPRLLPLLDDPLLVPAVAAALGALATEEATLPLTQAIVQPEAPVGPIAVALASIHDRLESELGEGALVADLVRHAATPETVATLAASLGRAGNDDLLGMITVLGWLPQAGIDRLLASYLANGSVRHVVAEAMATRGRPAADAILAVATTDDDALRQSAAGILGRIGDAVAVPVLLSMLSGARDVILAAAGALAAIGDRRAFPPLLDLLDDDDASVRHAAVSALSSIGHPGMEAAIRTRLDDASPRIRESAARIAGYFGYPSCLDAMIERTHDDDVSVRRAAAEHLASYDDPRAWAAIVAALRSDASHTVRAGAVRALGQAVDEQSRQALLDACDDANLWVRYYAIRSLAERGRADHNIADHIARIAREDAATPVRIAAIKAMGELRVSGHADLLEQLVQDPESDLAVAAIEALAMAGGPSATATLVRATASPDSRRAVAAMTALGMLRADDALSVVRHAATSASDELRSAAIQALARIASEASVDALLDVAGHRPFTGEAIAALSSMSEEQLPLVARGLTHGDERVRCAVIEALSRMKRSSASRLIGRLLDDPAASVRRTATLALTRG